MVELPETWKAIVDVLLRATVAWQTSARIAEALGRDVEETTDLLSQMDEAGWITVWDADPEPFLILSALAAERLHVHLVEVGPNETPRWARIGDPLPPSPKARNVPWMKQAAALDLVPASRPSPEVEAIRSEQVERRAILRAGAHVPRDPIASLPPPRLFRGEGLTPWPGPGQKGPSPCPACGGQPLRRHEYCLYCDRWGLDALLPSVPPPRVRRTCGPSGPVSRPQARAREEQTQAERERLQRKARRRAKLEARIEAARLRKRSGDPDLEPKPSAPGTAQD
jgi:hypothetical protein